MDLELEAAQVSGQKGQRSSLEQLSLGEQIALTVKLVVRQTLQSPPRDQTHLVQVGFGCPKYGFF